ncbi:MAG: hemolysin [Chloroflexi bacterium RBG_16_54_11]|nr:MAG: hemolysin [Chloroflexi bacterium RBG_16_54_11]
MGKTRLDLLLVERGLAESRSLAQRLVMAGQVRVDGEIVLRSAANVSTEARLEVESGPRFVSRGGEKLEAALQAFNVNVGGCVCADVGASTGGFTDCLLQHGAAKVYSIDVGQGILDWKLRNDPHVVVMEGTNARFLDRLPEPVELITIDASFISLKVLLPVVKGWLPSATGGSDSAGTVIALVKPQFEAGRRQAGRGKGVIRDPAIHRQVLLDVLEHTRREGYALRGLLRSPLTGPKGNVEFLAWLEYPAPLQGSLPEGLVDSVLAAAG